MYYLNEILHFVGATFFVLGAVILMLVQFIYMSKHGIFNKKLLTQSPFQSKYSKVGYLSGILGVVFIILGGILKFHLENLNIKIF